MLSQLKNDISFVFLDRIESLDIRESEGNSPLEMNFESFASLMEDFEVTEDKSQVNAFIPVRFKPESEWVANNHGNVRIDDNVAEVTMAVLDIDSPGALEQAKEAYKDHEYIIHNTHSYTKDTPYKFRMILKLEHPIPVEEWPSFFYKLVMPIGADTACSNVSRGYYMASISPSAGINPHFEYNKGKALTVDFINQQGEKYEKDLRQSNDVDKLNRYLYRVTERPEMEGRRDPITGNIRKDNVIHSRIDCTYEGYYKRHEKRIKEHLEENDHRNPFATTVIYNEFKMFKEAVDIPSLVAFLYRASLEHSSKPLHHGNTPSELPHLVDSAVHRIGSIAKPSSEFIRKLRASCNKAKAMCIQVMNTGDKSFWKFPDKPKRIAENKNVIETSFKEYEVEFKPELESFYKNRSWRKFAESILKSANDKNDPKEIYHLSRFVLKKTDDFFAKVLERKIDKSKFEDTLRSFSNDFAGDNDRLKAAINIGFSSYKDEMSQLKQMPSQSHNRGRGYPQ